MSGLVNKGIVVGEVAPEAAAGAARSAWFATVTCKSEVAAQIAFGRLLEEAPARSLSPARPSPRMAADAVDESIAIR